MDRSSFRGSLGFASRPLHGDEPSLASLRGRPQHWWLKTCASYRSSPRPPVSPQSSASQRYLSSLEVLPAGQGAKRVKW